MTSSFSPPIVCPVLIGRDDAMANLRSLLPGSGERGRVALIAGEAGIGKTRLLNEFLAEFTSAGLRAWQARFYEQDAALPYSGIARLVTAVAAQDAGAELLRPLAGELGGIAPSAFAGVVANAHPPEAVEAGSESERRRVLEGFRKLVKALNAEHNVILAFEDVHWADDSSTAAVLEIARDAAPGCLIILTYRSDEPSSALDALLADLDRERLASEIKLNHLGLMDVDRMLAAILGVGRAPRADVLHLVNQLTEGNPFFVEEVVRSLLDQAHSPEGLDARRLSELDVPRGINEAVRRRTKSLSSAARQVLTLAAVAGIRFDFPLLRELADRSEGELLVLIKELLAAQLVVEEDEDVFAFRHALTREAIRSELLLRERRELSRKIALSIESRHAADLDGHLEDLAWHFYEAGEWSAAFDYARRAGERAMALYSPAAALTHLTRAIDAGHRLEGASLGDVDRQRGATNEALGNSEAARSDYERAAQLALGSGEPRVRWQALIDLGLLWASRDYSHSEPCFRAALDLARELGDPLALGHTLNRLGNWYSNAGDFDAALGLSEEALSVFRQAGDELGVAQTLDLLGMTSIQGMRFGTSVEYYREAIDLLERLGDRRTLASALASIQVCSSTYQTNMLPPAISLADASVLGEKALALSRQLGWKSAEAYALWQLSFCLGPQGEYGRALDCARESLSIAQEIGHTQWEIGALCALGAVLTDILATEQAEEWLHEAEALCREMGSVPWAGQVEALLIDVAVAGGRDSPARTSDSTADSNALGFAELPLLASQADLALARGDPGGAIEMLQRLEAAAERCVPGVPSVRLARLRGRLLAAAGHPDAAIDQLRHAREEAERQGNVSLRWRIYSDMARLLHQLGDRDAARAAATRTIEISDALAQQIPDPVLRENFVSRAAHTLPAVLRRRASGGHVETLTVREAETATLIAQGLTNREIADRLVLSVRTVESHVASAMAKLGFTTRSQLAAWAVERGILNP